MHQKIIPQAIRTALNPNWRNTRSRLMGRNRSRLPTVAATAMAVALSLTACSDQRPADTAGNAASGTLHSRTVAGNASGAQSHASGRKLESREPALISLQKRLRTDDADAVAYEDQRQEAEAVRPVAPVLAEATPAGPAAAAQAPARQTAGQVQQSRSRELAGTRNADAIMMAPATGAVLQSANAIEPRLHPAPLPNTPGDLVRAPTEPPNTENYQDFDDNPVKLVAQEPVSTFSIDVDTGAYSNVRRYLNGGQLPPRNAVRVEEMINYFDYAYAAPADRSRPFSVTSTLTEAPWHPGRHLLRIGIQAYDLAPAEVPSANLVFLLDVSGSMRSPDKLGLLKSGLKLLTSKLRAQDRISIVVYAGGTGVVLPPTAGNEHYRIEQALDGLRAGGSTNGAAGIKLAYQMARQAFVPGGINCVLLATDGDFNVGTTNLQTLKDLVAREREGGVSLTTLGFGKGNYNEALMEQLANIGNGNYAYVDSLKEANKVLVQQMAGTLATIAKDVKIQIEFNPAEVSEYRLIGYENRALRREDFNNDKVDAGEIGAGHNVTALYELTLAGSAHPHMPALRYGANQTVSETLNDSNGEIGHLRVRYKAPQGKTSQLLAWPLARKAIEQSVAQTDDDFRFAAAVAGFGQLLRGGEQLENFGYAEVAQLARAARGADILGYRSEFLQLVSLAQSIDRRASLNVPPAVQTADGRTQ